MNIFLFKSKQMGSLVFLNEIFPKRLDDEEKDVRFFFACNLSRMHGVKQCLLGFRLFERMAQREKLLVALKKRILPWQCFLVQIVMAPIYPFMRGVVPAHEK